MENAPDIRPARRADRDALGALWVAFLREQTEHDPRLGVADDALERWQNDYAMWLNDGSRCLSVAAPDDDDDASGDDIVGFVAAEQWGPPPIYAEASEVYLTELYVMPAARRNGIGRQLVGAVRKWAEAKGAVRIRLRALVRNEAGQAFWAAQQAEPLSTVFTIDLNPDAASDDESDDESKASRRIGF